MTKALQECKASPDIDLATVQAASPEHTAQVTIPDLPALLFAWPWELSWMLQKRYRGPQLRLH